MLGRCRARHRDTGARHHARQGHADYPDRRVPLHVIDTAGLRESADEVEKIGIARAWSEIEGADAVLFLHDLTRADAAQYIADDADIATTLATKLSKTRQ